MVTVASVSVATTEYYKDKESGERKDITQWHNITVTGDIQILDKKEADPTNGLV